EFYLTTALAAGIPSAILLIGAITVCICVMKRRARTNRRGQENVSGNLNERTSTAEIAVHRLDNISTENTKVETWARSSGSYALR
ncbi:hypothetical protein ACJMK2_022986, partial [Sinanodonta woodiana]